MDLMNEKVVLITGSTSGIGYYTALELARMGARVVVHGRDEARCIASVRAIQDETRNASITYLLADFSSQTQVRSMSGDFLDRHDHLDVLVNNAGAAYLFRKLSKDGLEMTFAVNYLAPFLLTEALLERGLPRRAVINVASTGQEPIEK